LAKTVKSFFRYDGEIFFSLLWRQQKLNTADAAAFFGWQNALIMMFPVAKKAPFSHQNMLLTDPKVSHVNRKQEIPVGQ